MSRKLPYLLIVLLIGIGIATFIIISSLIIKQPALLAGKTTSTRTNESSTNVAVTETWVLPVFTATSSDFTAATPSSTDPTNNYLADTAAPNTSSPSVEATPSVEIPLENQEIFCGRFDKITVIGLILEDNLESQNPRVKMVTYLRFDYVEQSITLLSLPSSLIVSGRTISSLNLPDSSLMELYEFTVGNIQRPDLAPDVIGVNAIGRALYENIGIVPDFMFVIMAAEFSELINHIGDLTVEDASNSEDEVLDQKIDGQQAWKLISGNNYTKETLENQEKILRASIDRLNNPDSLQKIPTLITRFSEYATTDLDQDLLVQMVCLLENLQSDDIRFLHIQPFLESAKSGGWVIQNQEDVYDWLKREF